MVDTAIEKQVDFIIHAGDLVNHPRPPTAALNRLLQELPRLKEAGIPFIATVGTHDRPSSYFDKAGGDILQLLDARLGLAKRIDTDQTPRFEFKTKQGMRISAYGLGDHGEDAETQLLELRKQMNQEGNFSILVMHGSVSSMPQMIGSAVKTETISELLSKKYVDYVALGHNHRRWEHKDLQIYNPGSTEYTSFADAPTVSYAYDGKTLKEGSREPAEHGYYLVEVTGEIIKAQFKTLRTRDVWNVEVRFNEATAAQVVEGTKQAIEKTASSSSIIRPLLRGTLHPSVSRSEIGIQEIQSLRERMLFLDYPLIDLNANQGQLKTMEGSDVQQLLNQHLAAKLGKRSEETASIAAKLVELYAHKTKTAHQEALGIIDRWQPHD